MPFHIGAGNLSKVTTSGDGSPVTTSKRAFDGCNFQHLFGSSRPRTALESNSAIGQPGSIIGGDDVKVKDGS